MSPGGSGMSSSSSSSSGGDHTVTKFTKILPLSIRKDGYSSSSSSSGGGGEGGDSPMMSGGRNGGGDTRENVRVTLTYPSPSCGAMNPHKEIVLRLTNDDNPLFFYHLRITEADFPDLKSDQGLLVDFYGFPNQLVTLLERCDGGYSSNEGTGPKFALVMKIGIASVVLDIVESNPFKYLCHLSLQIGAGTDSEVKKYLCDVTTTLKKDLQLLQDKYSHLATSFESESARMKEKFGMMGEEITELKTELHTQANSLSTRHFQDMTQEKEKLLKLQSDLASKFEHERSDLERRHSITMSTLEDRVAHLETENRDLLQTKYKGETIMQENGNKIAHLEDDLKLLQKESTALRKQNEKLDHDYHEKHRVSMNLQSRVQSLESELRDKQGMLQKNYDQITQLSDVKKQLEEHAKAMVKEVERVQDVNKMVTSELNKANDIIKKLQDDIRNMSSKSKLQSQVTSEQERVIQDRDKTLADLEAKVASLTSSLSEIMSERDKHTELVEEAATKIAELEKTIESNQTMISWLNKQLNEFQGLSSLSRFRQNLAGSANAMQGGVGGTLDFVPPSAPNENSPPSHPSSAPSTGPTNFNLHARFGSSAAANTNLSNNNSVQNGTPSWMHMYQGTSTPLDDDLCARLEKVTTTNPILHQNYADIRSRFTDPFDTEKKGQGQDDEKTTTTTTTAAGRGRQPTWARGRGGRVTLDAGNPKSSGSGNLRR